MDEWNYTLAAEVGAGIFFAMKSTVLLIASEMLLILALGFVFSAWKGSVGFEFGWPLAKFKLSVTGGAQGIWVAMAVLALLGAAVTFVAGLAGAMKHPPARVS